MTIRKYRVTDDKGKSFDVGHRTAMQMTRDIPVVGVMSLEVRTANIADPYHKSQTFIYTIEEITNASI